MNTSHLPIGVFDSGMGGLTVLNALRDLLPQESFIYLGDTARLPYGTKDQDTIVRYSAQAAKALVDRGIKLLVIACNTATAAALPSLQALFAPLPVVGVIEAGAKAAVQASQTGQILVLATESTIRQQAYIKAIQALKPDASILGQACTLLVALAEECWFEGEVANDAIKRYLAPYMNLASHEKPDTIVLGCTHFPVFLPAIKTIVGPTISIVDSAKTTAHAVFELLEVHKIKTQATSKGQCAFLATDGSLRFARVASCFLGETFTEENVEIINL